MENVKDVNKDCKKREIYKVPLQSIDSPRLALTLLGSVFVSLARVHWNVFIA